MNTVDVMVDIETTGTTPGCGILSIGACTFDLKSKFEVAISRSSCREACLVDDPNTLAWWSKQDPDVYSKAFSGKTRLDYALGDFSDWLRTLGAPLNKVYVWGNSAKFDLGIIEAAYAASNMVYPINYKNERCYRTLKNLYHNIKQGEFKGDKHNALHDAMHQAEHARSILQKHFSLIKEL